MRPKEVLVYPDGEDTIIVSAWWGVFNYKLSLRGYQARKLIRSLQSSLRVMVWEKKNLEGIENESI